MASRAFGLFLPVLLAAGCGRQGEAREGAGRWLPPAAKAASVDRLEPVVLPPRSVAADGSLPIAAIFPTLGRYAVSGEQSLKGAELAVEELNRAGGIHGRALRLLVYKTGSYFVDAQDAAQRAARAGALAIVGSNSSELSLAVAEQAEAFRVLQITNVSTAADITSEPETGRRVRPWVFRMCASDDVIGDLLAVFARDRLGARRVAVLYEVGRSYSKNLARSFVRRFRNPAAGRVVQEFFYLALETDFRPQLTRIREFHPDVLFVPGSFPDATLVAAQSWQVGLHTTFLGGDAWSSPLLFQRGTPPGDAYYVELCRPIRDFDDRYAASFGSEPPGCRSVLAYDTVKVIAAALQRMGRLSDEDLGAGLGRARRRLRDAVARGKVRGETGPIRFDERGNRVQGVALYAVERTPTGPRALVSGWLGAQ